MFWNKKIIFGGLVTLTLGNILFLSKKTSSNHYKIMVNYNGQANLLMSLQIYPDYYPYQFKQKKLYEYISNANKYIVSNSNTSDKKNQIKTKFQTRLNKLINQISEFGDTLWNDDLYNGGLVTRNDQFWNSKSTDYLFIEQFIADDYMNIDDSVSLLPQHQNLLVTNYRVAKDPYTVFGKEVFEYFKQQKKSGTSTDKSKDQNNSNTFNQKFYEYYKNYNLANQNSLYRFGKFIEFWNEYLDEIFSSSDSSSDQVMKLFEGKDKLFHTFNTEQDAKLAQLYQDNLFSEEEKKLLKEWSKNDQESTEWKLEYLKKEENKQAQPAARVANAHHPSLEHTVIKGSAPLAEGSQKDVMVYLYQFASVLDKISKEQSFNTTFADDPRKEFISNALKNAKEMVKNYYERLTNIRDYFKKLKVIDESFDPSSGNYAKTNSKSLAIITYPPTAQGSGDATIQSISKFPFIYGDLGFQQVFPKDNNGNDNHHHDWSEIFSVDDNGWWWRIGNTNISKNNLDSFKGTADSIIFLSTMNDWNVLTGDIGLKLNSFFTILKEQSQEKNKYQINDINKPKFPFSFSEYHLWNEGLRSPIAINLLLDHLVEIIQRTYETEPNNHKEEYKKALDWGSYWENSFIEEKSSISNPTS